MLLLVKLTTMRTLLLILLLVPMMSFGQAPESFNYQAVVRNAGGIILNNQPVGMRLTVQQGSIGGTAVYTETFTSTTNDYGLVNLEIGTGTSTDDFSTIDWANGPYFMETAVDVTGGTTYSVMGTSQLMSVPYALYAKTSGNGEGPVGPAGNDGIDGVDGAIGATGPIGNDGAVGATGAQGTIGLTGATGPQGPAGTDGVDGQDGIDGAQGPEGPQGATGNNGINGPTFISPLEFYYEYSNSGGYNNFDVDFNLLLGATPNAVIVQITFEGDNGGGSYGTPSRCNIDALSNSNIYDAFDFWVDGSWAYGYGQGSSSSQIILPVNPNGTINFDTFIIRGGLSNKGESHLNQTHLFYTSMMMVQLRGKWY